MVEEVEEAVEAEAEEEAAMATSGLPETVVSKEVSRTTVPSTTIVMLVAGEVTWVAMHP